MAEQLAELLKKGGSDKISYAVITHASHGNDAGTMDTNDGSLFSMGAGTLGGGSGSSFSGSITVKKSGKYRVYAVTLNRGSGSAYITMGSTWLTYSRGTAAYTGEMDISANTVFTAVTTTGDGVALATLMIMKAT